MKTATNEISTLNDYSRRTPLEEVAFVFISIGGFVFTIIYKAWLYSVRKPVVVNDLLTPISTQDITVFASNHQKRTDAPAIFAAIATKDMLNAAPVKFLTWHRYYHSVLKPILFITGCFPTHSKNKLHGVTAAVHYALKGYRIFVFPEGKRTKHTVVPKPYKGIGQIMEDLPEARLILVSIDWEPRYSTFSRPQITIKMSDKPKSLDSTSPMDIMTKIYQQKNAKIKA